MFSVAPHYVGNTHKKIIFIFPHWGGAWYLYLFLAWILNFSGYDSIIYAYDKTILTPDPELTTKNILSVVAKTRMDIEKLKMKKKEPFAVFGTSIGTVIAVLVANESSCKKVILNLSGSDMAKVIWSWDRQVPHFKAMLLKNGITLYSLIKQWKHISPVYNISKFKNKDVLLYLSEHDELIPFVLGKELYDKIKQETKIQLLVNKSKGHFSAGLTNLLKVPVYNAFLHK